MGNPHHKWIVSILHILIDKAIIIKKIGHSLIGPYSAWSSKSVLSSSFSFFTPVMDRIFLLGIFQKYCVGDLKTG